MGSVDPVKAVSNLGLNASFHTSQLTVNDVVFEQPSYDTTTQFEPSASKQYRLLKEMGGTNRLKYEEDKLIHEYTERSYDFLPASAYNVNTLYEYLSDKLRSQLLVENAEEIVENRKGWLNL